MIVSAVISVFVVIGIGAMVRQLGWLSEEADNSLLKLIIRVLLPCLIFTVISDNPTLKEADNLILPPIVGFFSIALGFAVATLVGRLARGWHGLVDAKARRTFVLCIGVYNYGYIPIPLIKLLFDDQTLGVLFVHNLGSELAIWTLGVALISSTASSRWWRQMINPPTVTIAVALLFNFLGLAAHLPEFLTTAIEWLGHAAIPMSMVLIGATIADQLRHNGNAWNTVDSAKQIAWSVLLRLCVLPTAFLLVAMLLPCTIELKRVIVVAAAMPSAVFPILLARLYGGDSAAALRVVLGTSIASILTIPLWIRAGIALLEFTGGGF